MDITRDVILDLMPLYLADEVSRDTRALIEDYLKKDPELAEIARRKSDAAFPLNGEMPLTKEDKMQAYLEAKRLMFRRTLVHAVIIACGILGMAGLVILAFFFMPA
jgi:hypothetical protein